MIDYIDEISIKLKSIREELSLYQSVVIKGVMEMIKNKEVSLKNPSSYKFTQTTLSVIENNRKGVSSDRVFLLIKYYEIKHHINPGYFLTNSKLVPKDIMSNLFDLGGDGISKDAYLKIFAKYKPALYDIQEKIIKDIIDKNKNS